MRFHPDARQRAGIIARLQPAVAAVLTCLPLAAQAADPPPAEILKKMQAVYNAVNTYQVTIKTSQSGKAKNGQAYTLSVTQVIKTKKPNLFSLQITQVGTGAAAPYSRTQLAVNDGKMVYQYDPQRKLYAKAPAPPGLPGIPPIQIAALKYVPSSLKLLPASNIGGHPVYEVQALPDIPKTATATAPKSIILSIDKSNYNLLKYSVSGSNAGLVFLNQVVNGPIAGSAFVFNPPAGAKLYTPPPPTQPGAVAPGGIAPGGVPGGPPHRP